MILNNLYKIIKERKKTMPKNSYIATLFRQGNDRILQKVGEEAIEVVIAGKVNNQKRLIAEISDLVFMLLILLVSKQIKLNDIYYELKSRQA